MKYLIALALTFTTLAHAGNERGNGGDAVVCYNTDGSIKNVEFFDLYEAKERFDFSLVPARAETVNAKVEELIARIENLNPTRARKYRAWAREFFEETKFLVNKELTDIPDTGMAFFPRDCTLKQAVVQQEPQLPNDKRYFINNEYWQAMDLDNRAALIVHELVLRETAMEFAHQTSQNARYFHAMIEADRIKDLSIHGYLALLNTIKFSNADYKGLKVSLPDAQFAEPGVLVYASVLNSAVLEIGASKVRIECKERHDISPLKVSFQPNGTIIQFIIQGDTNNECILSELTHAKANHKLTVTNPAQVRWVDGKLKFIETQQYGTGILLNSAVLQIESTHSADLFLQFSDGEVVNKADINRVGMAKVFLHGNWIGVQKVALNDNGQLIGFIPQTLTKITVGRNLFYIGKHGVVHLDDAGNIKHVDFASYHTQAWIGSREVVIRHKVDFHPNGEISSAVLSDRDTFMPVAGGEEKRICTGSRVDFNTNGEVTNFSENLDCSGLFDFLRK